MDSNRFDALARSLGAAGSRRSALAGIVAAGASLATFGNSDASRRDRRHRRRSKRRLKHLRRKVRNQPSPPQDPGASTCTGSNGCDDRQCQVNGVTCFCRINAATSEYFCGGSVSDALNCGQCGGGTVCVDLSACSGAGAVGCAVTCG